MSATLPPSPHVPPLPQWTQWTRRAPAWTPTLDWRGGAWGAPPGPGVASNASAGPQPVASISSEPHGRRVQTRLLERSGGSVPCRGGGGHTTTTRVWGHTHTHTRVTMTCGGRGKSGVLPPPNDDGAGGVAGGQQALVAIEGDGQHGPAVALQRVDGGPRRTPHVEKVHAGVLAARHCGDKGMARGRNRRPRSPRRPQNRARARVCVPAP